MKVKFLGSSDAQVSFSGHDDPRKYLVIGEIYELERKEVHTWHTEYYLKDFSGLDFNSVCFEEVLDGEDDQ